MNTEERNDIVAQIKVLVEKLGPPPTSQELYPAGTYMLTPTERVRPLYDDEMICVTYVQVNEDNSGCEYEIVDGMPKHCMQIAADNMFSGAAGRVSIAVGYGFDATRLA